MQTEQGRLYLFVGIDRTSKFAFTQLHPKATTRIAADFLRALVKAVPYKVHTVLTDNGIHFTDPKGDAWSPAEIRQMLADKQLFRAHSFEYACALLDIDHRLTKPAHSLDQWPGRANEPDDQGSNRPTLPLRHP